VPDANLVHTVGFFQGVFTIILALALGEALKQFVGDSDDRYIHWDRLPALLAFLLTIFPFFQGMSQHLYLNYLHAAAAPRFYAAYLSVDGLVFLLQAACFYMMSRALAAKHWRRFYWALLTLLAIDVLWDLFCLWRGIQLIDWLYLDLLLAAVLLAVLWRERGMASAATLRPPLICLAAVFVSTGLSYYLMRDVYFP
jgi:hypothetical protein